MVRMRADVCRAPFSEAKQFVANTNGLHTLQEHTVKDRIYREKFANETVMLQKAEHVWGTTVF